MTKLCPGCGLDLQADEPIWRPEIFFDPRGQVLFHGKSMNLTVTERMVLHALLKADGRAIGHEALRERIDSPETANVAQVMVCRLRVKFAQVDASREWIETIRGVGYRWTGGDGARR